MEGMAIINDTIRNNNMLAKHANAPAEVQVDTSRVNWKVTSSTMHEKEAVPMSQCPPLKPFASVVFNTMHGRKKHMIP